MSQSSTFVKQLAANDLPTRKKAIKSLKSFISSRKNFPLMEYEKLWKGLFYAMWFSDKPRPQQYLAKELGELVLDVPAKEYEKFVLAYWLIITKEWSGIDHHRLDKFLLLVRRSLHYQIKRLKVEEYNESLMNSFLEDLKKCPLSGDKRIPNGIPFHIIDIYCDELEKIMFEDLEKEGDFEEYDEDEKSEIIKATPIETLLKPIVELQKTAIYKPLRVKIKDEFFEDPRLIQWGFQFNEKKEKEKETEEEFQDAKEEQNSEHEESESEESEEEWTGFE